LALQSCTPSHHREVLTKRSTDSAIPFVTLIVTVAAFGTAISGFFSPYSLQESTRQLGEFSLVVIGELVVMLGGGLDLAVGAIFALSTPEMFNTAWAASIRQ
jgi:ribose transport system permease protein